MTDGSEIDATSVFFPIPVTRRLGTVATTDFLRCYRFLFHSVLCGLLCSGYGHVDWAGIGRGFAYHVVLAMHKILILPPLPDNLPVSASSFFALPDHAVVALDGPDATAFAQAQFANDVAALSPGHWHWNAWLTPKGRVIAVFALLKLAEDRILLLVSDTDAGEFAAQLQRFVFRRKLKIAVADGLQVSGTFEKPDSAESARIGIVGETIELDYGSDQQPRTLRLSPTVAPTLESTFQAHWFAQDLRAGLPRLPAAQREQWTPQQLSLERLHAFSVKKGCYPGQEIVARTHFLGKAKRGLVLFESDAPLATGDIVSDGSRPLGQIVSVLSASPSLALAVLPLDREPGSLGVDGTQLREIALLDGLAR
jgi:tRNA-modifying protein YgfZ